MEYLYKNGEIELTIEQRAKQMNDEIIDRLVAYRKRLHMTQQDIADTTGIQRANVARMESKRYMSSVEGLMKYAECMGLELQFEMTVPQEKSEKRPLPIGLSDFCKVSQEYCYVDKTLLIRDILDERAGVLLFTRPRRFGKSLNMDMLRVFFEKTSEDTSIYFKDKKIWKCGETYRRQQGKYPVIYLSFKDVKFPAWQDAFTFLKFVLAIEFNRHPELFDSDRCNTFEKDYFCKVAAAEATEVDLTQALFMLSKMLDAHYQVAPMIIIDEYDTPIQQGYVHGYYDKVIAFMRNLFSAGFKDNPHLSQGFMTGILRVAKESIFSSLNNLQVYSVLDNRYSEYFGFTPEEVRDMAAYYDEEDKYEEICEWYDGYRFGNTDIFNPWSVIGYFNSGCEAKAFWVSTSSNDIIGEILQASSNEIQEQLFHLLSGRTVFTRIDTDVIYPEMKGNPASVYSFLLVAGYLKIVRCEREVAGEYMYEVAIPNKEISAVYSKEILSKLTEVIPSSSALIIQEAIYRNDMDALQKQLQKLLLQTISYNDASKESFYHGFVLGLCALLDNRYYITSNRESGEGRFDIQLMPQNDKLPGILIEVKAGKNCTEDELEQLAHNALEQIAAKKYDEMMKSQGVKEIIKYGVAFCGKAVKIKSEY